MLQSRGLPEDGRARIHRWHIRRKRGGGRWDRPGAGFAMPAMAVIGITLMQSCGDGTIEPAPPPATVAATVAVSPGSATLSALGVTARFTAEVRDQNGQVMAGATVAWTSSDASVASVDASGQATSTGNGTATITVAAGSASGTAAVTVAQVVTAVVLSPAADTLVAFGDTVRLVAEATDANGHAVAGSEFIWSSSDTLVARVDDSGLVAGVDEGTATITATARDYSGTAEITTVENTDRAALVALYEATDGPNWVNNDNWLTDAPLGEWYGVSADDRGRVTTLRLEENGLYGHIPPQLGLMGELHRLELDDNQLTRTIPPTLGKLTKLAGLFLSRNHLEGTIPPELGDLTELQHLWLNENRLSGSIPPALGSLYNLRHLNLGWNTLTGPIPPALGTLASLQSLRLNVNELTGPIPRELGDLAELEDLALGNNGLTGRIPLWLANLTQLTELGLHGNELTGTIPPGLGSLAELTSLSLDSNQLTGPIPPELGNLLQLEWLGLASNRLTGPVPPELGNLRSLVELTLNGNMLTGSIPQTLVELNNLVALGCRRTEGVCLPATEAFREWAQQVEARGGIQNAVDIPWCDEIDAQALERLYQATNGGGWTRSDGWLEDESLGQWHGVRTDSVGRVTGLDLSGNGLSGHLPDAMGLLANLAELRIGHNALSGRMPLSLAGLPLEEFDYSDTSLCAADDAGFRQWLGGIPRHRGTGAQCPPLTEREALEWLYRRTDGSGWNKSTGWLTDVPLENWHGVQTNASGRVVGLSLRKNGLAGSIPAEIGELSALTHLDLRSNRLEGGIPGEIGRLSELRVLDLSFNALTGPIPVEIGALTALTNLNLRGNRLSDAIPPEIGRLSELRGLDLRSNSLSGPLPPRLGDLAQLESLSLGWNHLSGGIPTELRRLSALTVMELAHNGLSGSIPPELGTLNRLEALYLESNQFSGEIPTEVGGLANLVQLRLAQNQLSGSIPPGLGTLDRLNQLYLESNQLSGGIPEEIGSLANLAWLNLGDNELSGPLPAALGRASKLESLDLRSNGLSGPLPPEFANLTLLKSLILAGNTGLAGPLPPGIRTLGRLERFMAGGTGLCRPADSSFDAWFGSIPERRLVRCEGGAAVYLTQAVQSWDDPVPILAGEPALLRVFVTVPEEAAATMPELRATFYVDGTERHTVRIASGTQPIPSEVIEGDLELSANADVPDWLVVPGLEMVIEVDPARTLDPALGVTKRIPEEGRMAIDVRAVPPLHMTLVPFLTESEPDPSIAESVLAMAGDPSGHELLRDVRTLLPVTGFAVTAHEPVTTSFQDPFRLIRETEAMRIMEGGKGYWMGIIEPPPRTGGANWWFVLPIGVAFTGGRASVAIREPSVMAHELGHNLSLGHAPCGNPRGVDPWFPYSIGNTGAWGYDFAERALVAPRTPDLMSYCRNQGYWISDYFFNKALNHRLAEGGTTAGAMAAEADPMRTLLLWGGRGEDGVPYLDPAFVVDAVPSLPRAGTEYSIVGADADGTALFSFTFDMPDIGDAESEEASFVFALPVQADWANDLASITLSGPGGSVALDDSTDRPMAILRDPRTRQVRAFLSDLPPATQTAADAVGQGTGQGMDVLFSRGMPGADAWWR